MLLRKNLETGLFFGFTAVLIGYFSVWLPGPGAGLELTGLEIGEWLKFMGMGPTRNWFYLPPVTLGVMLALLPLTWPPGGRKNWGIGALAVFVSLLAFPAVEDITGPAWRAYVVRLVGVVGVTAVVLLTGIIHQRQPTAIVWTFLAFLGLLAAAVPLWFFIQARPALEKLLAQPIDIGWGLWLNTAGNLWVTAVSLTLYVISSQYSRQKSAQN